jgi:RNA polymerase sigma-70 factor (ECF subfamily)
MDVQGENTDFLQSMVDCQRRLYAYILKLVVNTADAQDVLQETNLVLIRKQDEFSTIENFPAWAAHIAYNQVLAHWSKRRRDRLHFDDELLRQLADEGAGRIGLPDSDLRVLGDCLDKLGPQDRELLGKRYETNLTARQIAPEIGRSAQAISQALYRIRCTLMRCIDENRSAGGKDLD